MKKLLTFLVALAFVIGTWGHALAWTASDASGVTKDGLFIEMTGSLIDGDISGTSPEDICSSTWGCNIDWIIFVCGADGDKVQIKWKTEDGILIFPDSDCADADQVPFIVEYYGDPIDFFLDYSGSSLSDDARILIKLKGETER